MFFINVNNIYRLSIDYLKYNFKYINNFKA